MSTIRACQKSLFDKLVDGGVNYPQFAMVTLLRLAACSVPASQFSMVAPHRSQAHSRCSLLHWAHRRLLHPQFAMVVLLRPTACSTPASQFSMVTSLRSQSSLEMLPASLGSSAAIAATGCAASFALIGLTTACFRHRRRPSCAPLQFPLKSYGFPGAETARKRFLLWKMGFSGAKIAPSPPYTPPGTIEAREGRALRAPPYTGEPFGK